MLPHGERGGSCGGGGLHEDGQGLQDGGEPGVLCCNIGVGAGSSTKCVVVCRSQPPHFGLQKRSVACRTIVYRRGYRTPPVDRLSRFNSSVAKRVMAPSVTVSSSHRRKTSPFAALALFLLWIDEALKVGPGVLRVR